jgi:uncharacterized alpha-E superfamily protein
VQGSDLVVRDGFVWMKPAGWPARPTDRIDVIIRRVDAAWCDPLELRGDSRLGVAGLSEAVRRGHVRLVNGLGAGVLENPGLLPYLPAACEYLLGEQLRIPSVPTVWCGEPEARDSVLSRLRAGDRGLIVRTIDEPRKAFSEMSADELIARIASAPHRFVGQDLLPLSQTPVWSSADDLGARIDALPLTLRAFALRYGSAYRPLVGVWRPCGRARRSPRTKDVWVLKASEDDPDQNLTEIAPAPTARSIPPLAPRAHADMFWTGRYAERAEDLLRLLLTAQTELDQPRAYVAGRLAESPRVLLDVLGRLAGMRSLDPEAEFRSLLLDVRRPGSAAHAIARLREAMEGVRDQLSGDTWRVFATIDRATRALRGSAHPHRTAESGADAVGHAVAVRHHGEHDPRHRLAHDRSGPLPRARASAVRTAGDGSRRAPCSPRRAERLGGGAPGRRERRDHRRRYRGSMRAADVLDLLLLDHSNPRSLAFALARLREHLAAMPASTGSTRAERLLDHLETELAAIDVAALDAVENGRRDALVEFLAGVTAQLEQLSDAVTHLHFESGPPPSR